METGRMVDLPPDRRIEIPLLAHRKTGRVARWSWVLWLAAPLLLWLSLRGVPFVAIQDSIDGIAAWQLAGLVFLNAGILLLLAYRWQLVLRAFGHAIPIGKILAYRLAGFGVSYFTPGPQFGGEPLQVLLLQRKEGISTVDGVTSVFFDKLLELLANFTFLVVGLSVAGMNGLLPVRLNGLAGLGLVGLLLLPAVHIFLLWKGYRPLTAMIVGMSRRASWKPLTVAAQHALAAEDQIGEFCRQRPFSLLGLVGVSALVWLLSIYEFHWLLSSLGVPLRLPQTISLLAALRVAFLLPVPAGLGTMEAAFVFTGSLIGLSPAVGLSAALMIRARDVFLALAGVWFVGWTLHPRRLPVKAS
jgi:glycosyltransferase 2 family protein